MKQLRKVLIVSYYYPPSAEMGAFRILRFTRHLPDFGFQPYVLTVQNRSHGSIDPALLNDIPPDVRVIKTFSAEHRLLRAPRLVGLDPRWIFLPDTHIGWLPFAVHRGAAIIRREDIDVMLASGPVFTSLLIGCRLKQKTGVPFVADFRDPWTQSVFTTHPTALHRRMERRMEHAVLNAADYVVTTTEAMRQAMIETYPFLANRSVVISNGYDAEDFDGLVREPSSGRFTIVYVGRIYGPRTTGHFLTAVRRLVDRDSALRESMRIVFAGPRDHRTESLVNGLRLREVVDFLGFVPHRAGLQLMVNADVLLLLMAREEAVGAGSSTIVIPGKTFEYLGARRPILALVPEGAVSAMIRETGSGLVVPPDETSKIEGAIRSLFDTWKAGKLRVEDIDISQYDRRNAAARLATLLDSCCLNVSG